MDAAPIHLKKLVLAESSRFAQICLYVELKLFADLDIGVVSA